MREERINVGERKVEEIQIRLLTPKANRRQQYKMSKNAIFVVY